MKVKTVISLLLIVAGTVLAQDNTAVDKLTVPFSDPSKPGLVEAGLLNGSITVTGYPGKEVQIEADNRMKKIEDEHDFDIDVDIDFNTGSRSSSRSRSRSRSSGEKKKDLNGLKKISGSTSSIEVTEEDNRMEIDVNSWKHAVDLSIKVPHNTSIILNTVNDGDILVSDVKGEIEVKALNGEVTLKNVGGVVVANSHNGDLTVQMNRIETGKPMAFTSFNGDVDVTLPANAKANVKIKTQNGDIYTDFEMTKIPDPSSIVHDKTHDKDGKYHVKIDRSHYATINGGGSEFNFKTFNGDIIIRQGK